MFSTITFAVRIFYIYFPPTLVDTQVYFLQILLFYQGLPFQWIYYFAQKMSDSPWISLFLSIKSNIIISLKCLICCLNVLCLLSLFNRKLFFQQYLNPLSCSHHPLPIIQFLVHKPKIVKIIEPEYVSINYNHTLKLSQDKSQKDAT